MVKPLRAGSAKPRILDYSCKSKETQGPDVALLRQQGIAFPQVHTQSEAMMRYAKVLQRAPGDPLRLPFCHTVEAQALGATVHLGDWSAGPRVRETFYPSLEDFLNAPDINFNNGRIHQVLCAVRQLKRQGEIVVLDIAGPLTVLAQLVELPVILRGWRKQLDVVEACLAKVCASLLAYFYQAEAAGAALISYGDPTAACGIIGPLYSQQLASTSTATLLDSARGLLGENFGIHLCPKTTFALLAAKMITPRRLSSPCHPEYVQACLQARSSRLLFGQRCLDASQVKGYGGLVGFAWKKE